LIDYSYFIEIHLPLASEYGLSRQDLNSETYLSPLSDIKKILSKKKPWRLWKQEETMENIRNYEDI
jgi:hypothetical protein